MKLTKGPTYYRHKTSGMYYYGTVLYTYTNQESVVSARELGSGHTRVFFEKDLEHVEPVFKGFTDSVQCDIGRFKVFRRYENGNISVLPDYYESSQKAARTIFEIPPLIDGFPPSVPNN